MADGIQFGARKANITDVFNYDFPTVGSSLNLDLEYLNVSISSKRPEIIHGRRHPYQILENFDYAAVRLETDAYLNT